MKTDVSFSVLRKRLFAVGMAITFLFCVFLSRFGYIQVIWQDDLMPRAVAQWTRELPVVAERGLIRDRNGELLAGNRTAYSIYARASAVKDPQNSANVLSALLNVPQSELYEKLTDRSRSEITVLKRVEKALVEKIEGANLAGIYYARDNVRVYPYSELASQLIGFTSADGVGVTGIESYCNDYLSGTNGEILYDTDLVGAEVGGIEYLSSVNGLDITLTIDVRVQTLVEEVMSRAMQAYAAKSACCIVLDPNDFSVVALANLPSYNLNEVPRDDIGILNAQSRNTIVSDAYEPGSTFKVITAAANIEEYLRGNKNAFSNRHVFSSSRTRIVDGSTVRCWSDHKNGKHVNQTLAMALNNSCNPCFVDIALSLGTQTFYDYLTAFGFGMATGIDFSGESVGMLLPKSTVKDGDLARIGFGQTIAVTPLQLACATAAAVNGGYYCTPYLVKEIASSDGRVEYHAQKRLARRTVSSEASSILSSMLEGVVTDGSGKNAYIEGYRVAGKTGTAQKYENGTIAVGKYVSSFVGYFPAQNPRYLTLVIVDEPQGAYYGSTVAAPLAKEIFQGIIDIMRIERFA